MNLVFLSSTIRVKTILLLLDFVTGRKGYVFPGTRTDMWDGGWGRYRVNWIVSVCEGNLQFRLGNGFSVLFSFILTYQYLTYSVIRNLYRF